MTEEDAKTKWCPMVRLYTPNGPANRDGEYEPVTDKGVTCCIASECMWFVPERRSKEGSMTVVDGGYCGAIGGSFK